MLNSEDMFKARAMEERKKEMAKLESKLKGEKKIGSVRTKAMDIIARKGDLTLETQSKFNTQEIKILLHFKLGKTTGKKIELIERYISTPMPPKIDRFNAEDGRRLEELRSGLVPLRETALEVAAKQNASVLINSLHHLDESERQKLLQALQESTTDDDNKPLGNLKDDRHYL